MAGYYYFNCNGPVQVGPWANYNEALHDCEETYGGPCEFLGCSKPPCGAPGNTELSWKPSDEFITIATQRRLDCAKQAAIGGQASGDTASNEVPSMTETMGSESNKSITITAVVSREAVPCHQCGCQRYIDFDPQDGLCDNLNGSNPAEYCKHPLVSHYLD
jgi:hypothetical protein